jgi:hypothetical protein
MLNAKIRIAKPVPFPVVIVIYNRPDCTERLCGVIRNLPLQELVVVADGPRATPEDRALCRRTRAVVESIEFACPVRRLYTDHNMGSGYRLPPAITSVLAHSEAAIIIEDDCIPSTSFFRFCVDLLETFADDEEVMMISGINSLGEWRHGEADYLFSTLGHAQAWATWRRAWRHFDPDMTGWADSAARDAVARFVDDPDQLERRCQIYGHPIAARHWDYQWAFQRQRRHGLCAVPCRNLVTHRGGDPRATHNRTPRLLDHLTDAGELDFPLTRPPSMVPDRLFDRMVFEATVGPLTLASAKLIATRLLERGQGRRAIVLLQLISREIALDEEARRLVAQALSLARPSPDLPRTS